jgi:hypothetical protein
LTHFIQRCLEPCTTPEQRAGIQAQVEKVIAKAIQEGNLHTKNWHLEPLITAPSLPDNDTYSYYGPTPNLSNSDAHPLPAHSPKSSNPSLSHISFSLQSKSPKQSSLTKKAKKHNLWPAEDEGLDRSTTALQKRQKRFSGPGGLSVNGSLTSESTTTESDYGQYMGLRTIGQSHLQVLTEQDFERMTVKGTCTILEKDYLRLTAPPRAELVRPESILKQHLDNLKQEYYNDKRHDYLWFCSQLKVSHDAQCCGTLKTTMLNTHACNSSLVRPIA